MRGNVSMVTLRKALSYRSDISQQVWINSLTVP